MRPLTRGRMNQNGRGWLGSAGQRCLALLVASAPAALMAGACTSEPTPVKIGDGGAAGSVAIDPSDGDRIARCGDDGVVCGEGCCTAGNACSADERCIPSTDCTGTEDCSGDSQCAAGTCQPWTVLPKELRFSQSCRTTVDLPSVVPTVQCQWPGDTRPAVEPEMVQVISTPMVVDFNSDNDPKTSHPSIVFISYTGAFDQVTGVIRVIDGESCELQDTIVGIKPFTPQVPVALGDINNDGKPDIIAADEETFGASKRSGIAAFELDGRGPSPSPKFRPMQNGRVVSAGTSTISGFGIYDVDNDEYPEIFTEKTMLHFDPAQGALVNVAAILPDDKLADGSTRAPLNSIEPPTVVDIDGDKISEVVTPQGIFHWDVTNRVFIDKSRGGLQPLWNPNPDDNLGAFLAIANLEDNWSTGLPEGKDSAEVVVVGRSGDLWVRQVDGRTRLAVQSDDLSAGPPVIADVDGDGRMEFATGGRDRLTVFDLDCTEDFFNARGCENGKGKARANGVLWQSTAQGVQSGAAVFDFDGDGSAELVYADQCFMRVYDGKTGDVLFSAPRMSTTQWEYPVVADTDGDGYSELVTASNDNDGTVKCPATDEQNQNAVVNFEPTHGVTVWKEENDRWAGSRPIWNQHNYFVTNVRDDGTIPPMGEVQNHWQGGGPNSFRQNVQGTTGRSLTLADVTTAGVPAFKCNPSLGTATVTVDLCNRGAVALRPDEAEIALVDARPERTTNVLCRQRNEEAIESGKCAEVECDIAVPPGQDPFDVMIMGDPTDQVRECYEQNNRSLLSRVSCDPLGPQ
jgi:VCBS repeat protein